LDNQDIEKAKRLVELLNNRYLSVTIDDLLNQQQVVDKLEQDLETSRRALSKLETKYEDKDKEYKIVSSLFNKVLKMENKLLDFTKAASKKA